MKNNSPLKPRTLLRGLSANDNALGRVRSLTISDMEVILAEHAGAIGAAIDTFAQKDGVSSGRYAAAVDVLFMLPELQRWIVWYGSDRKRPEVDQLDAEDGALLNACIDVMQATRAEYVSEELDQFLIGALHESSEYLKSRGARR